MNFGASLLKLAAPSEYSPEAMERSRSEPVARLLAATPAVPAPAPASIPAPAQIPSYLSQTPAGNSAVSADDSSRYTRSFSTIPAEPPAEGRHGGSLSWRNQNPGNIRYGDFAKAHGATPGAKGFASFPSEEAGRAAGVDLLKTKSYQKLDVAGAISRWAPPTENDTSAYIKDIQKRTGFDPHRQMSTLNEQDLGKIFTQGIQPHEGWVPGK